ncbi:putative C6 transcription factor Prf [Aspergillus homomorphus CBS 101889]|uniref:Zn(2)-C6 fungal-type domain-containing protein n=1 Tax=Aspergillus homomorphus (strain CBS 101889) TaxID=1450537 RepID=A0A395IDJ9_ASPHC|nr:hypothetical protein BO97DRAFT_334551 [Aspergillus homomorphus CBS 101889]RAL17233.1 hypothetical protein BO97DRAFT_334551 [Aspergillus homomorphus CBS 101889]
MTDLNRPPHLADNHPSSSQDLQINITQETGHSDADSHYVPRPKRIACVLCRRRKLRCDGKRPSCGTCSRLGHECVFDEVRKKSGPKRGYVKQLEARLAQVENLLKNQKTNPTPDQGSSFTGSVANPSTDIPDILAIINESSAFQQRHDRVPDPFSAQVFQHAGTTNTPNYGMEMISLGLEEPLPSQGIIDELNEIYFKKIHPGMPILHRPRLLAAMSLGPSTRPPLCLQYIMWSHAASISDKYSSLHSVFYERARKYAEADELRGLGEHAVSLGHCQAWVLICSYEFKMMFFPRAWLSSGKAARLAIMMGLNRVDGEGIDVKQTLTAAKDWSEKEERRRVFWMAYCADRFASIGTGWPVVFDDKDVLTKLPASEESFIKNQPEETISLEAAYLGEGMSTLSAFGGVSFMASIFGKNLAHLHRPNPHEDDHDLNGVYWQRHRSHDNILLHFSLTMPSHLRLSVGTTDPNVIFCSMAIHTATICLHQAAIYKAEKNKMPGPIATESKRRCILAAEQISNILRLSSHVDPSKMSVLTPFCVYVAARVFVQYLKFRPDDSAARSSLQFVFSALHLLKTKNPLAESFIFQLDLDTAGTVWSDFNQSKKACFMRAGLQRDAVRAIPSVEIRRNTNQSLSPGLC